MNDGNTKLGVHAKGLLFFFGGVDRSHSPVMSGSQHSSSNMLVIWRRNFMSLFTHMLTKFEKGEAIQKSPYSWLGF